MPKCMRCGSRIEFVRTSGGKYMPVEPVPIYGMERPEGAITMITSNGVRIRADEVAQGAERAVKGWVPHFVRCADNIALRQVREEAKTARLAREAAERAEAMKPKQTSMFGGA